MKTTDKIQKTGNQKSNEVKSVVIAAVVGLAFVSSTEISTLVKNSNKSFISETGLEKILQVDPWMTDVSNFTSNVVIKGALEYNPAEFVNAEMAIEKERLVNDNYETVEAELALQDKALTNESEYDAAKFVEDEMRLENEKWMDNEDFLEAAETYTADGSELEVAKYAQKIINAVETETALKVNLLDENFLNTAETLTADGAEQEVAKYAKQQLICCRN